VAQDLKADGRILVQAGVYRNDRQVREKHVYHGIDKANPRAEVAVTALLMQARELPVQPADDSALDDPTNPLLRD
jgi:hypothetical protein